MLNKILERIKDRKYYLIIMAILLIFLIFMDQPFEKEKYKYMAKNSENIIGQTDLFVAGNKLSQKFKTERDDFVNLGIKVVTQDRKINSKVNVKIEEVASKETIYDKDISLENAQNDLYFNIKIDKQKASKNKEYELIITSIDANNENAIIFALAENTENSGETYKYNNEEVTSNKLMLSTEYYSSTNEIFNIFLWILIFVLSIIFILLFLDIADEKTFLKLTICFTILYVFITPFPQYLDEGAHFFRALLISQGDFYHEFDENGEIGGYVSKNYFDYVFNGLTAKKLSNNTAPTKDFYSGEKQFNSFKYFSSTVPLAHSVSAAGLFVGHILHLNGYLTVYLGRIFAYLFYVVCAYFAIKNLKYYKSTMFIVATLPIGFYMAGTISVDPIINGSSLLFISICLKYYFANEEDTYISIKDIILIIITAIFIITTKYLSYTPLVLLFFLIPKKKFKTTKLYVTMIVISVIIGILCVLWQFYMLKAFPFEEDRNGHVNQAEQIEFTLSHPIFVTRKLSNQVLSLSKLHSGLYAPDPMGCLPDLTGVALVVGAILEKNKFNNNKRKKFLSISLIIIFIIALLLANFALYLSYSPVGDDRIHGYQARYNIPILMLALIPLANCFDLKNNTKNHERNIAFFMFLLNLDELIALLVTVFNLP